MNNKLNNCKLEDLSICYTTSKDKPQDLMSNWTFVTKETCSELCKNLSTCRTVLDLLAKLKPDVARDYLERYFIK